jgi:hypothetical protein
VIIPLKDETRHCGDCTLCCKVLGVEEGDFHKRKDQWCAHATKRHGCGIYETRPSKCRDFACLWLTGQFGRDEHRPDKIHGVVTPTTDGKNWVIHEDPGFPGHARAVLKRAITTWLDRGKEFYVVVVCGDKRSYNGDVRTFKQMIDAGAPDFAGARDITEPRAR